LASYSTKEKTFTAEGAKGFAEVAEESLGVVCEILCVFCV